MTKVNLFLGVLLFSFLSIFSQEENINNYKYIIVPERFEFQKSEDSFQINSLTKFLFNKYGYNVLLSSEQYPEDLSRNKCLALTTRMKENSGMFGKKINFDLANCSNIIVYSSRAGVSKEKDFKRSYHQAIRKAFESLKSVNYNYLVNDNALKSPSELEIVEVENPQTVKVIPEVIQEVIPAVKSIVKTSPVEEPKKIKSFLIAQDISNGFNLFDNTNKSQYELQETSVKNIYIVKGIDGVLFKSENKWILEYYVDNQFFKKELHIKF
jgi:hypothetical protein